MLAYRHAEPRRSVQAVDFEDVGPPDRGVVGDEADDEREPVPSGLARSCFRVHATPGQAPRPLAHEARRVGVLVPAMDVLGILGLDGPEVDALAADEGIGAFRSVRHRRGWYAATDGP